MPQFESSQFIVAAGFEINIVSDSFVEHRPQRTSRRTMTVCPMEKVNLSEAKTNKQYR